MRETAGGVCRCRQSGLEGMEILEPDLEAFKSTAVKVINDKLDGDLWPAGLYDKVRNLK